MRLAALLGLVIVAAACDDVIPPPATAAPTADNGRVMVAEYGADWPFVIASGTLRCFPSSDGSRVAVTLTDETGNEFGLNGAAMDDGFPGVDGSVLKRFPDLSGLQPIVERGLRLCEQ